MKNGVAGDLWVIGGLSKATRFDFPVEVFNAWGKKKNNKTVPIGRIACASGGSGAG
jgi:hypothetical protein